MRKFLFVLLIAVLALFLAGNALAERTEKPNLHAAVPRPVFRLRRGQADERRGS